MNAKTDVVVKLALVFFISLLSFSVGLFVGKKYSDNVHKTAALEPEKKAEMAREIASEGHEATPTKSNQNLSDEEIAKLAEEFVSDDAEKTANHDAHGEAPAHGEAKAETAAHADVKAETAKHGEAPAHNDTAKNDHSTPTKDVHSAPAKNTEPAKHGETSTHEVAAKDVHSAPAKTVKAGAHNEEKREPSSIPKDITQYNTGKFTVQIAAYASEKEAQEKVNGLKEKGYSAYFFTAQIKGKTWYRVGVGLFATEVEAKKYKSEFMAKTNTSTAMIQKITQ